MGLCASSRVVNWQEANEPRQTLTDDELVHLCRHMASERFVPIPIPAIRADLLQRHHCAVDTG
jgi:hypothetical protein